MAKHEEKYCPRCTALFECKVGSITLCQCTQTKISQEEQTYIGQKHSDCLCIKCIKDLQSKYQIKKYNESLKKILGVYFKEDE